VSLTKVGRDEFPLADGAEEAAYQAIVAAQTRQS